MIEKYLEKVIVLTLSTADDALGVIEIFPLTALKTPRASSKNNFGKDLA